ncbi:hypothetical protein A3Q56_03203 [Intoshia linei]|uniref:Condensin complex subunit 2 n=1 Tax=Intoshia linei TaxID=1819745 RepID=A0A177B439_9BILA|nr:hypothetical protein A3Q56_03203 [Intoshia linei]
MKRNSEITNFESQSTSKSRKLNSTLMNDIKPEFTDIKRENLNFSQISHLNQTVERDSIQNCNGTDTNLVINDDNIEIKTLRRKSMITESFKLENRELTEPTNDAVFENPLGKLSQIQVTEHYASCIKLSAENKINSRNAFGLHLINSLSNLVNKQNTVTDFKKAGTTIDASAKIYAGRVDAVYNDSYKVLGGLGKPSDKIDTNNDESVGDILNTQTKKKKNSHRKNAPIELNLKSITNSRGETIEINPFHQKISSMYDVEKLSLKSMIQCMYSDSTLSTMIKSCDRKIVDCTNSMKPSQHDFHLIIDNSTILSNISQFSANAVNVPICIYFHNFTFSQPLQTIDAEQHQIESFHEDSVDDASVTEICNNECESPILNHTNMFDNTGLQSFYNDFQNNEGIMNLIATTITDKSKIEKFTVLINGPAKYTLRNSNKTLPSILQSKATKSLFISKRKNRLTKKQKCFNIKNNVAQSLDSSNSKISNNPKSTKLLLGHEFLKPWYPNVVSFLTVNLIKNESFLGALKECKKKSDTDSQDVPSNSLAIDDDDSVECGGFDADITLVESDPETLDINFEEGNDNQIKEPLKLEKLQVAYSRQAKIVNVKLVKKLMWRNLDFDVALLDITNQSNQTLQETETVKKDILFSNVMSDVKSNLPSTMKDNVSMPVALVCLLHLANEKNLVIKSKNLADLIISTENLSM